MPSKKVLIFCIASAAAIYLTIKVDAVGKRTADGKLLETQADVTAYMLDKAGLAVVPFYAFGSSLSNPWYRLSVGTCKKSEISEMIDKLGEALRKLEEEQRKNFEPITAVHT